MAEFLLGMNAKTYYNGTAGAALGSLIELSNIKNATLNLEAGEADVTTRANGGWRATTSTLRTATFEFEMVWKPADLAFKAIRDAYLTSALMEFAILDQDIATSGAQGIKGSFAITSFTRNEQLEEGIGVNVTAKLSTFDQWVTV